MPGAVLLEVADNVNHIEAPVTWKAYLICAFASFGGIYFGYDSGYINGVNADALFIQIIEGPDATTLKSSHQSLIVSILSAGTFFGAIIAGDVAEIIGRKWTVISGCGIYAIGVVVQMITGPGHGLGVIVGGRLIAGFGVGFESAIVILYMSEICPKKVRGAVVSGYQFCITIGLLLASCVVYATQDDKDTGSYRIPIAIQFVWALGLGGGLLFLPDSPRTGVNFIFYYSTPFLKSTGAIKNSFIITLIFSLVNVFSTPISFWSVERFGRRPLLIWGALGMLICQFLVAIIGVTVGFNHTHLDPQGNTIADNIPAVNAQIAFIAIFIFFFASTWGPGSWVVIGEVFPLPIRSRGVGLSTASNWLWNTIIAVITPFMVGEDHGDLKSSVFFVWGGLCSAAFVYAYFLVPETKGLSLEQVDQMMEESTPRTSPKWKPTVTFASQQRTDGGKLSTALIENVERKGSIW
ncbi:hypothetical protein DV737_g1308, partial [Chaetothyriales sp. CBS 132003]